MSIFKSTYVMTAATLMIAACTGIPYNPATNSDTTPPSLGIRITGDSHTSIYDPQHNTLNPAIPLTAVDIGVRVPGTPVIPVHIHENGEASVLATAQDSGSGIRSIKLICQRHVYYNWDPASQTEADTLLLPDVSEQVNHINNGYVPETGILQQKLNMTGLMAFKNAAGTITRGHGVAVTCSAEASNFNGNSVMTQGVVIWARKDLSPFVDGMVYRTTDAADEIQVHVEQNAVAADTVEFVLNAGPNVLWRKEIVIVEGSGSGTGRWTIFTQDSRKTDRNGLYTNQLPDARLEFRKAKLFGGVAEVSRIDIGTVRPGSRITFTWVKD